MDSVHCTLCVKKCLPKEEMSLHSNLELNNPSRGRKEEDALQNELQVIFLLRKILEIPRDICCTFLTEYGDPCSWIDFCNSCLVLVQKGKVIFDQMTALQKQFQTIQNQVQKQMTNTQMERKLDESKRRIKEGILSYANPAISSVGNIVPKEESFHLLSSSGEDVTESNCFVAINNANNLSVKTELNESFVYPLNAMANEWDGCGHYPEENDPLMLLENGDDGVSNSKLEERQESEFVTVKQIKLEPEFLSETSDVNFSTISCDSNEQSEVAKSPTYIIPQMVKETPLNLNTKQDQNKGDFRCEVCGKHFKKNYGLKVHTRIHTGEKPYECVTCGKAFTKSSTLYEHQMRHTGERTFKCSFCEKAFTTSSDLMQHERRHTGQKRYKCSFCEKCFVERREVTVHERVHTGERPYKCDICGKDFPRKDTLHEHKKRHTYYGM